VGQDNVRFSPFASGFGLVLWRS